MNPKDISPETHAWYAAVRKTNIALLGPIQQKRVKDAISALARECLSWNSGDGFVLYSPFSLFPNERITQATAYLEHACLTFAQEADGFEFIHRRAANGFIAALHLALVKLKESRPTGKPTPGVITNARGEAVVESRMPAKVVAHG